MNGLYLVKTERKETDLNPEILYREVIGVGMIGVIKRAPDGNVDLEVYDNGSYVEQLHCKKRTLAEAKAVLIGMMAAFEIHKIHKRLDGKE